MVVLYVIKADLAAILLLHIVHSLPNIYQTTKRNVKSVLHHLLHFDSFDTLLEPQRILLTPSPVEIRNPQLRSVDE